MAKFCASCGSPVEEALKFCPKCGAQLGAPAAPAPATAGPAAAAGAGAPVAAGGPAVAAPVAKGGSPILKIVLIVLGILALVTVVGIGSCVYIGYRIKQKATAMMESAGTATRGLSTPEIHIEKGGAGSEAEASATAEVPPYPGSTATEAGGELSFGGMGGISGQGYETEDSLEKVVAFYKDKLGSKARFQQSDGNVIFTLTTSKGLTTVTITREDEAEKTKINITRIGK